MALEVENPYAAPLSGIDAAPPLEHYGDASRVQRLLNSLVDVVGMLISAPIMSVVLFLALDAREIESIPNNAIVAGLLFVYYVGPEWVFGRTLGKVLTGTKVIAVGNGGRTGILRIVLRTAVRMVPFEPFSYLPRRGRGWHDGVSGTRVVRLRRPGVQAYRDGSRELLCAPREYENGSAILISNSSTVSPTPTVGAS